MPAIIGGFVKVVNMGTGGVASFGDTAFISPKSANKSYVGSGSFLTGDFAKTVDLLNNTNTIDADVVDDNVIGRS